MDERHARVMVVGSGPVADAAVAELGGAARVSDPSGLGDPRLRAGGHVALAVVVVGDEDADDLVAAVLAQAGHPHPRVLVVTGRLQLPDLSRSVDGGHLGGVVVAPWTPGFLARYADAQLARHRRRREHTGAQDPGTDGGRAAGPGRPRAEADHPVSDLLRHLDQAPDAAAAELLTAVESVLGPRPRLTLQPHTRLTVEDDDVEQVFLVLRGRVALSVATRAGALTLHHGSTGPLIGLLSLAERRRAGVTARTTSECEVVPLTVEQLDRALSEDARVGAALTALTVRALSARLRRAERLHVEKAELATELHAALRELEAARAGLVEQARLATLGELAAGVAHELNNPISAVVRGVEHLAHDVRSLVAGSGGPGGSAALAALEAAESRLRVPAAEERALRRDLAAATGADPALVRRLVAAGVTDPQQARALLAGPPGELARVEAAAGIGSTLRSLRTASEHVGGLVEALRAHARPDDPTAPAATTDVAGTVDAALRLVDHLLLGVRVRVDVEPGLPPVQSRPGRLTQVWANLLTNAADALDGSGHLALRARRTERGVRVEVEDDGPGVPPQLQERIFEPRFTTKHGVVRSGLGLGLAISRSIVVQHGGTISLDSRPGRTVFTVDLPATPPVPDRDDDRPPTDEETTR